jgi:hypothetical protein
LENNRLNEYYVGHCGESSDSSQHFRPHSRPALVEVKVRLQHRHKVKETSEGLMKLRGGLAFVPSLGDFGRQSGVTIQHFLLVVGASVIEHYVADHYEEFLALTTEAPGQGVLAGNVHESLTYPLPELLLGGPELVVVGTDYSGRLLRFHCCT